MNTDENIIPPFLRAVCSAICVIVHASLAECSLFIPSGTRKTGIPAFGKHVFADQGVIVELDHGRITIKIHVIARTGSVSLLKRAFELQRKISEEIYLLTLFQAEKVDVIITGIH
jgi:uncharacterized alkaline shock family protein YloU